MACSSNPTSSSARGTALGLILLYAAGISGSAGIPSAEVASPRQEPRIVVRVDLVNVGVTVTDARGSFLPHLKRENFRILDNSARQEITHFAPVEAPAQVLLLLEASPAVYLIHREHLAAAHLLLAGLAPDDRVALGTYAAAPRLLFDLTRDKLALAQALQEVPYSLGWAADLNFYDSLSAALDWLAGVPGKKSIVLLSTGLDTAPRDREETLKAKLRASDVAVFAVALGGELRRAGDGGKKGLPQDADVRERFQRADQAIAEIAQLTGGRAYFPSRPEQFAGVFREIASALRHQYVLGFEPSQRDGRYHTLEVRLVDEKGELLAPLPGKAALRVSARRGYSAPQ